MGFLKNGKNIFVKPYKAFTNKIIPVVNTLNNYLDSWFPSEKYNWRKIAIGWAILQALIITTLEFIVAKKNIEQVKAIYGYAIQINDKQILNELTATDSLTVYHMIFIVAQFFQLFLICDTVSKSSTIQLIIGTFFSIGLSGYSVIQWWQAKEGVTPSVEELKNSLHQGEIYELIIIGLMVVFCIGWVVIALRLYKIFGWNVFKQLGADIGVKNRLKLCQIFLAILKLDVFFFTSFTIQIFIFVVTNIFEGPTKIINCALLIVNFIILFLGFYAIKKESYVYMSLFIALLSISIGYMTYNVADIYYDEKEYNETKKISLRKYRNCKISLSVACYSSIIAGIITFVFALINFKNFPKGLKKDKSLRPTSSHNSTLSSSYNTGKRWSIE
ncbi:hypothetical protein BCR36DRAFT_306881 [Piromyces finnis]|uniref:Uncharacterized protein n=1 Tax=Piromyces finnis TaxID=1754191 RepID=A0A1Y1UXJ6_9FUNG|nr:hypothetical protein BCR36DRAFT_306881 [Piromyces finnis]|eukprot:ORX42439.1 hypothetical protein BCR36DRAFT_306881 [Piromyces finnis]